METKTRNFIAIVIVISFVVTFGFIAVAPIVMGTPAGEYTDLLKTYGAIFTGILGIILGYYMRANNTNNVN